MDKVKTNTIENFHKVKKNISENTLKLFNNNTWWAKLIKAIIVIIIVIIVIYFIKLLFKKYKDYKNSKPWILKGTKSAKKRMIILQDPSKNNAITLVRSKNEEKGLEFTYIFWMHINDWTVKYGEWKHVFHKGNESSWPLRAPGVWLHPKENTLRVYMNTFKDPSAHIDIPNIPINKWVCVTLAARHKNLDIYINGNVVKRKQFDSLIKQNYGDLYINSFQGFGGYMSNIRYFDYYISYPEIQAHLNRGPSIVPCVDSNEMPPYLSDNWWAGQYDQ